MQKKKPNILWICTDQQRWDTLACYGNEFVHTPHLDALARRGFLFERTYCQNPVCSPSRASFLTGRYPSTCGVRQNGQDIPEHEVLLPAILSKEGYTCGLSGKLHLSACMPKVCPTMERRIDDGYSQFHWSHHPGGITKNGWMMNEYGQWLLDSGIEYATQPFDDCQYIREGMPVQYHQSTWCTDKALSFIKAAARKETPWLFSINYYDPHHPFDPPKEFLEPYLEKLDTIPLPNYQEGELDDKPIFQRKDHRGAYDSPGNLSFDAMTDKDHRLVKAAYWAMIDLIDVQVGRLVDCLKETGELENTIIIFTSDHGELLGDHGMYLKGPHFYECSVHVPLIISLPGASGAGRRIPGLVELIDIAPTLLECSGIDPYEGIQGQSLLPLMQDGEEGRRDVFCEYYNSNIKHTSPKAYGTMVFDGRYKLIRYHGNEQELACSGELYDLKTDPHERINRWNDLQFGEVQMNMLGRLCDRMAFSRDPLPTRRAFW